MATATKSPREKAQDYMTKRAESGVLRGDTIRSVTKSNAAGRQNAAEYANAGPRGKQLQDQYRKAAEGGAYVKSKLKK